MSKIILLVPAFNCEPYIGATLKSLMAQGNALRRIERVILTDDASTDKTIEMARKIWQGPIPLDVFDASHNRGEYRNMNEAVARLPGDVEWFLIMHADNIAKPYWLETLLDRVALADNKIGTISTSWDFWHEDGHISAGEHREASIPERIVGDSASVKATIFRGCWWHISSCAIRVKTYREIGGLPLGLRLKGDWDFLLRLLASGWDVEYVPRSLMIYRANPNGSSSISFRRHNDVFETLTVARRYYGVMSGTWIVGYHGYQLVLLMRRFVGGVFRGNLARAMATFPMAGFTVCFTAKCLWERVRQRPLLDH